MPDVLFFGDTERSPAMRHELDLLLVTQDGSETLTRYPYDLTP
jgi:hypothetical protein